MGSFPRKVPLSLLWLLVCALLQTPTSAIRKSYIVYMGGHLHSRKEVSSVQTDVLTASHHEFLETFVGSKKKARDAIFYSYTRHINGFAAHLEEEEAIEISKSPGVMAVFPNEKHKLHTTRSWEFLGLESEGTVPEDSIWRKARLGEDTIIGSIDGGVWPESASFDDEGLGPIPSRWKGACESSPSNSIRCNRKLIGARVFYKGYIAAGRTLTASQITSRDSAGHGTHTLATAAGRFVPDASLFGFGNGTAKGGAPSARVAAYKVCWGPTESGDCFGADVLAAFDQAIEDGVDVLSVSLGHTAGDYIRDGLAIGSFHAVKNGITVVCSGGNSGPSWETVENVAPWILTVGASTMDRQFISYAILGSGVQLEGQSLSASSLPANQSYPLISGAGARAANSTVGEAWICSLGSLDPEKVKGKIVVCQLGNVSNVEKGQTVLLAGGVGVIVTSSVTLWNHVPADPHVLPAVALSYDNSLILYNYINSFTNPVAGIIAPTTVVGTKPAPFMAYFSSRGPNSVDPEILKPDITAPGVSVLAAYTEAVGPSDDSFDNRRVRFNIMSGTSMSCPHISGVAGLLKTLHPDWSPAAIKSAIMNTATTKDNLGQPILDSFFLTATPFSYGSGHVRPNLAMDPGLVYDLTVEDYLHFLCAHGYTSGQVATLYGAPFACPLIAPRVLDLNYPSISVPRLSAPTIVTRKVKNVGSPGTYTAQVTAPPGTLVKVTPATLVFSKYGQEEAFKVTVEAVAGAQASIYVYGFLTWSDGVHNVSSPIVVGIV
ncbi:unnamed protein product [Spirodela intermedia]|uniref:Uncharacterized protein n=2 Tax=Spirodela intermedia TaxID=51605 RepID=A0A7I8LK27_SPIIN|nr:unnamed protein product [Spirodela intermedia]CAA6672416.1 unnamed protein product [Spirodela intermedia]CAA7409608.1 unnamed protein product [Spirodela intermedia]